MGSTGEVLARIKGGRNCLCPSKEFLAESNRDTKAIQKFTSEEILGCIFSEKNPKLYITDVPDKGI